MSDDGRLVDVIGPMTRLGGGKHAWSADELARFGMEPAQPPPLIVTRDRHLVYGWDRVRALSAAGVDEAPVYILKEANERQLSELRSMLVAMYGDDGRPASYPLAPS